MLARSKDRRGMRGKARRDHGSTATRDRWMVSYMDVLTIVLMFFLGIAAETLRHPPAIAAATATPPATVQKAPVAAPQHPVTPVSESRQALLRAQKTLEEHGMTPQMEPEGLRISLSQAVLFASGEERVSPEALPILSEIADVLRDMPNDVKLIGHADSIPIHNRRFTSNWALAVARSLKIEELLSQQYGISESRLSIASYGPYRPNSPNDTPDGRARNRRVEILILDGADGPSGLVAEAARPRD